MENGKGHRLKYTIAATITTAAILVGGAFLGKGCMHEDIRKKRGQPEKEKKALVAEEEQREKVTKERAAKELAKLVTGVTPIEEEIEFINGVEIIDDKEGTVKKIIAEFPYEKMMCEEISEEDVLVRGENGGMDEFLSITGAIEKLGKEEKTEQLLSVLRYYDSLGIQWNTKIQPGTELIIPTFMGEIEATTDQEMDVAWPVLFDYTRMNRRATEEGTDLYDEECVSRHWNIMNRVGEVLEQLSKIWIKNGWNRDYLRKRLPETYQSQLDYVFMIEETSKMSEAAIQEAVDILNEVWGK